MIEGRVAAVLNERQVVINRGEGDGVYPDMEFAILEPEAIEVTDPDSNITLGSLEREKVRVRVVEVATMYCIAETFERYGGRGALIRDYGEVFKAVPSKVRTLRSGDVPYAPLVEEASYVKRGDRVREIEAVGS